MEMVLQLYDEGREGEGGGDGEEGGACLARPYRYVWGEATYPMHGYDGLIPRCGVREKWRRKTTAEQAAKATTDLQAVACFFVFDEAHYAEES